MTKPKLFIDSNIVLYLLSQDAEKANTAESMLKQRPAISVQVLNEVAHVCSRKLLMPWQEIVDFLFLVRSFCKVVPLTETIHDKALELAQAHQLSLYDACIVAAAADTRCGVLYSEDMHHGLSLNGLTILNPFRAF